MWEERWHPLREEWIIVAAHRQSRPWSGAEVGHQVPGLPRSIPHVGSMWPVVDLQHEARIRASADRGTELLQSRQQSGHQRCSRARYSAAGYTGAMQRIADHFAAGLPGVYVAPIEVFITYLHPGRKDRALEWLSKSIDARDPNVYGAVRDPFAIESLGDDPRFQNIVRRTGLPN